MGNRTITLLLLGLVLLIFISYFTVQNIVFPAGEPLGGLFIQVIQAADRGDWVQARQAAERLRRVWEQDRYLITLNYGEEDYSLFQASINRMYGAVLAKNKSETTGQAYAALELWHNFLKIVPEP